MQSISKEFRRHVHRNECWVQCYSSCTWQWPSNLPDDITSSSSLTVFRHKLQTHVFPQSCLDIIM